ncbi:hypothetical protein [Maridesulfovibrio ferrireducens]|uniref:hypothetical protein n=1 Tax=Maridesulfovibrio ferrireducens TaxID=246191 RepID=UPI0011133AC4|nr:hypothetical protein [Maridesulfovibrio ferrireducens]
MEERRSIKGNTKQEAKVRTKSRGAMLIGLQRVREVALRDKRAQFTTLLHHVSVNVLEYSFREIKLQDNLKCLHRKVHNSTYRAKPSKRICIPKYDGRKRPIGIASLEDKIVQHAVGKLLLIIMKLILKVFLMVLEQKEEHMILFLRSQLVQRKGK